MAPSQPLFLGSKWGVSSHTSSLHCLHHFFFSRELIPGLKILSINGQLSKVHLQPHPPPLTPDLFIPGPICASTWLPLIILICLTYVSCDSHPLLEIYTSLSGPRFMKSHSHSVIRTMKGDILDSSLFHSYIRSIAAPLSKCICIPLPTVALLTKYSPFWPGFLKQPPVDRDCCLPYQ